MRVGKESNGYGTHYSHRRAVTIDIQEGLKIRSVKSNDLSGNFHIFAELSTHALCPPIPTASLCPPARPVVI